MLTAPVSSEEVWKNFSPRPGEWAVQFLLETKGRIGSSVFFNPNSFRMTHWESFIQTWIYPTAFLAKPSHSLREPMQITLFKKVICYVKPTQLAVLDFSLPLLGLLFSIFNCRNWFIVGPIKQCSCYALPSNGAGHWSSAQFVNKIYCLVVTTPANWQAKYKFKRRHFLGIYSF